MQQSHLIQHNRSFRGAFSLIELLVVISLIALMVSMLLPSLSAVRDSMKITLCASNQHQLSVAHHSHAQDHDGFVAPSNYGSYSPYQFAGVGTPWIKGGYANPGGAEGMWIGTGLLFKKGYLTGGEMLFDPANNNFVQFDSPAVGFRSGTPWKSGNRWMNSNYIQRATIGAPNNGIVNVNHHPNGGTGRQVVIGQDPGDASFMMCRSDFGFSPDGVQSTVDWTHQTGYNVLYLDGGVDYVPLQGVSSQTQDPSVLGSQDLTIANYIKAMGITSFKYKPKQLEKMFYYKLDRQHPSKAPAP